MVTFHVNVLKASQLGFFLLRFDTPKKRKINLSLFHSGKKCFKRFLNLDRYQNLIICSLYNSGSIHKMSSQSVYNSLSNFANRQIDRQNNNQTHDSENITSAPEVITQINSWRISPRPVSPRLISLSLRSLLNGHNLLEMIGS